MPDSLDTKTHERASRSEVEVLREEIVRLRARIEALEYQTYLQSWKDNPDRMGS